MLDLVTQSVLILSRISLVPALWRPWDSFLNQPSIDMVDTGMTPALGKLKPGDHESRVGEHSEFSPDHTARVSKQRQTTHRPAPVYKEAV